MDSEDESHSSNSSGSESSGSRPSSPLPNENSLSGIDVNQQSPGSPTPNEVEEKQRSRSRSMSNDNISSPYNEDSNSNSRTSNRQNDNDVSNNNSASVSRNQSISPVRRNSSDEEKPEDDDELVLSDIDEEPTKRSNAALDISHEDLSEISDLESAPQSPVLSDEPDNSGVTDLRQKLEERKLHLKQLNGSGTLSDSLEKHDEDILDFEAEEGECRDIPDAAVDSKEDNKNGETKDQGAKSESELEEGEELEDGEVTDGDEKRPEENEPKPVCRFYTRGQCTWGVSCRFLHPGVTDKGNYTMFDMVRPIPIAHQNPQVVPFANYPDYRTERPVIHHMPPAAYSAPAQHARQPMPEPESAWERGLRTAKEMMRKASKRKEQDMDFDDKKMNLSLTIDEAEKDNYYNRASPEVVAPVKVSTPPYASNPRHSGGPQYDYSPPAKFARGSGPSTGGFQEEPYGRMPRYRELPAHRMPHYEDDELNKRRLAQRGVPTREVIISQKADDWNDPWMRSKSPGGRERSAGGRAEKRGRRERSYSSNSSYSSSSSSRSGSASSDSSRSPSPSTHRRYDNHRGKEPERDRHHATQPPRGKPVRGRSRSASPQKRRFSPVRSPYKRGGAVPEKKANISPAPINDRRRGLDRGSSPSTATLKRKKAPSPLPATRKPSTHHAPGARKKRRTSSSETGSDSSGTDSGSESTTSGSSSKVVKNKAAKVTKKVEMTKKRPDPVIAAADEEDKNIPGDKSSKQKSTRREELLKQLRAVEDAIARKRSKIN